MKRPALSVHLWASPLIVGGAVLAATACSGDEPAPIVVDEACAAEGRSAGDRFADGDPKGHAAPEGARAAGQARAGRIDSAAQIRAPKNPRARIKLGDYLLANDKIALYIGNEQLSDGMSMYGGEILALDVVGDDGLPRGESTYGETLFALSRQVVAPERVSVLKDGSDGGEAIVRAEGVLQNVAFLDPFRGFLPHEYNFPAALDYVLRPGEDHVIVRFSVLNPRDEEVDFSGKENIGLFHSYTTQTFSPTRGFGPPMGRSDWLAFDPLTATPTLADRADAAPLQSTAFSLRALGSDLDFGISVSGFQYFVANGFKVGRCGESTVDYAELTVSAGGFDGLRQALTPNGTITSEGRVLGNDGQPIANAWVFADQNETLYSRTRTDAAGRYVIHAPSDATLVAFAEGHAPSAKIAIAQSLDLQLPPSGALAFRVKDKDTHSAIPVRVQVIPELGEGEVPITDLPKRYGIQAQPAGAMAPRFALQGEARIEAPPGRYRVVISRGYEYEVFERSFEVKAGETVGQDVELEHSVDSSGVMCGDFHVHSKLSFDSDDTVRAKVASAIADGLELPVSSEHEWVLDFMPTIRDLGMTDFAYSFPSQELTTFGNGHFGVVPLMPRPERRNNGAIHWIGRHLGEVFAEVRALPEKPVLIVNHPSTGGFLGYFLTVKFDPATASGSGDEWSDNFEAIEVFNSETFDTARDTAVRDWFALLNAGKKYFAVGNSDSHHIVDSPVGYPRTCMVFGHDDPKRLSAEAVRDALRGGGTTISGGIFLRVTGPGGELPWQTVAGGGEFTVSVQAPSYVGVKELEVIVDGQVTETIALGASDDARVGKHFTRKVQVAAPSGGGHHWVLFHVRGEGALAPLHPTRAPFAVSNPFWL